MKSRCTYDVLSPDGFSIHREDTYSSKQKAYDAFVNWKKNYEIQGYYSSTEHGRIPLDELHNYVTIVKINN